MALIIKDRIKETTTTTGTGAVSLAGAMTGFKTLASVMADNDTCYYCIQGVDVSGNPSGEWETGLGTYNTSGNTLTRTIVQDSSNSGSVVTFSSGTKQIFIDVTSSYLATLATSGLATSSGITMATSRLLGRTTASTGAIEEITVGAGLALSAGALTASSALKLLSTVTASNSATVDVETTFDSTYDEYILIATGITVASNGVNLRAEFKIGGSYVNSGYIGHTMKPQSGTATYSGIANITSYVEILSSIGNASSKSADATIRIHNPSSAAFQKMVDFNGVCIDDSGLVRAGFGVASNTGTDAMTGIRFFAGTGNILAGKFRLYGVSNS